MGCPARAHQGIGQDALNKLCRLIGTHRWQAIGIGQEIGKQAPGRLTGRPGPDRSVKARRRGGQGLHGQDQTANRRLNRHRASVKHRRCPIKGSRQPVQKVRCRIQIGKTARVFRLRKSPRCLIKAAL